MFSWDNAKKRSLEHKLEIAKHQAQSKCDPQFNIDHPDETRDGTRKDFTKLQIRVKNEFQKHQDRLERKRSKRNAD